MSASLTRVKRLKKHMIDMALFLNPVFGGMACAFTILPTADLRVQRLLLPTVLTCILGTLAPLVAFFRLRRSRRADAFLTGSGLFACATAWHFLVCSLFLLSKARALGEASVFQLVGGAGAVSIGLVGLLEWRVMPRLWERWTRSGRIDLARGVYRTSQEVPSSSSGVWSQALIGWGAAVGTVCGVFLRRVAGADLRMLVGGVIGVAAVFMFVGMAWAAGFGMLFRVARWERRTGRKLRV